MTTPGWILAAAIFLGVIWWLFRWFTKEEPEEDFDTKVPPLALPPFETLRWTNHGYWLGRGHSPAWAGFSAESGSSDATPSDGSFKVYVFPRNPKRERTPSDAQKKAYQFQIEHAGVVAGVILSALPKYYSDLREEQMLSVQSMPDINNPEKFRSLIELGAMTIHPFQKDGLGYVGLLFACGWDSEHQFGVMLHGSKIVAIGDHDAASEDARPAEAQDT